MAAGYHTSSALKHKSIVCDGPAYAVQSADHIKHKVLPGPAPEKCRDLHPTYVLAGRMMGTGLQYEHSVSVLKPVNRRSSLDILVETPFAACQQHTETGEGNLFRNCRSHFRESLAVRHNEVETLSMAQEAVEAGADIIMLDNMSHDEMKQAVRLIGGRALVEISGNVTRESVSALKDIGADVVSCGALTHSAPILDVSLKNLHPVSAG